jgi:hypothetical protein
MALQDRKQGDHAQLERVREFNNELIESITEKRKTTATAIGAMFDQNPKLNDTLAKLILVDSKGQHKNERNMLAGRSEKPKKITAPKFEDQVNDEEDDIYKMM